MLDTGFSVAGSVERVACSGGEGKSKVEGQNGKWKNTGSGVKGKAYRAFAPIYPNICLIVDLGIVDIVSGKCAVAVLCNCIN